jgi:PAS domain S-box-containing protein
MEESVVAQHRHPRDGTILIHRGMIHFLSEGARVIFGNGGREMVLTDFLSCFHPDDREAVRELTSRTDTRDGDAGGATMSRVIDARGDEKAFELEAEPVDWEGESGLLVHVRRIKKGTKPPASNRKPDDLYRLVVERATERVAVVSDGTIEYLNPALSELLGYTPREVSGRAFLELVLDEDREKAADLLNPGKPGDSGSAPVKLRVIGRDGNAIRVEIVCSPIVRGSREGIIVYIRTIADEVRASETVTDGLEQMKYFLDNLTDIAYMSDDRGYITYMNNAAEAISGVKLSDILNKPPKLMLFATESREMALDAFQAVMSGQTFECELTFRNGLTFDFKNQPLRGKDGQIIGAFGIAREITRGRNEEEKLKREAQQQSAILNSMYERIQYLDNKMRIVWANKSVCHSIGLGLEEIEGNQCYQLFHRRAEPCEGCPAVKALKSGHIQKGEIPYPDGKTWLLRSYPIRDESLAVIGVTIKSVDIGEQAQDRQKISQLVSIGRSATKDGTRFSAPLDPEYLYPFSLFIDYQNDEFDIGLKWKEFNKEFSLNRLTRSETATARFIYLAARMKASPPGWVDKDTIKPGKRDINVNALRRLLENSNIPWCDKISARMLIRSSRDENKRIRLAILPENIEISRRIKDYRSKKHKYVSGIAEKIAYLEEGLADSQGADAYIKEELKIQRINRINILKSIETVEYLIHETIKILDSSETHMKQ